MGLNFRKSITIFPGVKLNLSKSGVGISTGVKGARVSLNSKGQARTTLGIPGTGIYYTKQVSTKKMAGELKNKITGKNKAKTNGLGKSTETPEVPDAASAASTAAVSAAAEQRAANSEQVREYEEYIDSIRSVHKASDGSIDWQSLRDNDVPADIVKGSDEYREWNALREYADRVLEGDIDAYFEVIDFVKPFDDLLEFGSNFQVGTDDPDSLEVEFSVKSEDVVPSVQLSLNAKGEISEKELAKGAYYDLVQDYVCSTALRTARDTFALLPVKKVVVHAVDNVLNTATGYEEEMTLLSIVFDKETLMSLNLAMVDPSNALTNFKHNMKFKKTAGFAPVERLHAES